MTEALQFFDENISEIILAMTVNLEDDLASINDKDIGDNWIAKDVKKLIIENKLGSRIKRLKRAIGYKKAKEHPFTSSGITDNMVDMAREYPIEELFDEKLQKTSKYYIGKCPFHNEKTASFYIKRKTNKFKCYGCGEWGDSIDFYMKQNNVNFIQAVKLLNK